MKYVHFTYIQFFHKTFNNTYIIIHFHIFFIHLFTHTHTYTHIYLYTFLNSLNLPYTVKSIFDTCLNTHYPTCPQESLTFLCFYTFNYTFNYTFLSSWISSFHYHTIKAQMNSSSSPSSTIWHL